MKDAPKWKIGLVWFLTVVLALFMALVGSGKFTQPEAWTRIATTVDVPYWLMQVAGVMEMVGAVLLLVPRVAALGGVTVATVMAGAVLAQVMGEQPGGAISPLVFGASALFIARQRADQLPWRSTVPQGELA